MPDTLVRRDPTFEGWGGRTIDLREHAKAVTRVTEADLALIRSFALREVGAEEIRVYEARVANNRVDRDHERFSEEILADFAETLVGKSVLIGHQWGPPGVGRVFKAALIEQDGTLWLSASFFIPVLGNEKLLNDIDLGVATWVSIGFYAPDRVEIVGKDGRPIYHEYRRGPGGERGEAIELSFVFLGAQYDAAVVKGVLGALRRQCRRPEAARALERALGRSEAPVTVEPDEAGRGLEGDALGDDGLSDRRSTGRSALPFEVHGRLARAPKDRPWDPEAALARVRAWASADGSGDPGTIDWARYAQAFAWRDDERPETLAGYRFLHHDVERGELVHHWEGTVRAMAALWSRTVELTDADRRAVYEHLAEEYRAWGETPPDLATLEALAAQARGADAAEAARLEAAILARCRGPRGAWARFLGLVEQAARTVFGASAGLEPEGVGPTASATTTEEGGMDPKLVEEWTTQLATLTGRVAELGTSVGALERALAALERGQQELAARVAELAERVEGAAEDLKMLEEAGHKTLARVEDLERVAGLGGARGEPDDEGSQGPREPARKSATELFGLIITPDPLRARRAAVLGGR